MNPTTIPTSSYLEFPFFANRKSSPNNPVKILQPKVHLAKKGPVFDPSFRYPYHPSTQRNLPSPSHGHCQISTRAGGRTRGHSARDYIVRVHPPRRGSAVPWNPPGKSLKVRGEEAGERASGQAIPHRAAAADVNFTQNIRLHIETQTQWPRQVGRGAVLAARGSRARDRDARVRVRSQAAGRGAERVGARVPVPVLTHWPTWGQVYLWYYINWVPSSLRRTVYRLAQIGCRVSILGMK